MEAEAATAASDLQTDSNDVHAIAGDAQSEPAQASGRLSSLTVLSWNIDGLDEEDSISRVGAVCDEILRLQPHVVLLQEVTDYISVVIIKRLKFEYTGRMRKLQEYYCVILVKTCSSMKLDRAVEMLPFAGSHMGRYLLSQHILIDGRSFTFMTTHLESTKRRRTERVKQLRTTIDRMQSLADSSTVVLGGDLNLRDEELSSIGGLPPPLRDAWIECGLKSKTKFTWDMQLNDNKVMFKSQARFDRLFYSFSNMRATEFSLIGMERVVTCGRYPSDHFGMLCRFELSA